MSDFTARKVVVVVVVGGGGAVAVATLFMKGIHITIQNCQTSGPQSRNLIKMVYTDTIS